MKNKILLSLLIIVGLVTIVGCGNDKSNSSSGEKSDTFKIKDISFVFDQDSEFHNFKYKNSQELKMDESKQSLSLEYVNKDIYDGRFLYRISLSFSNDINLETLLNGYDTEKVKINGIDWNKIILNNVTDNKETKSVAYATEKDSNVYVVSTIVFEEANVDVVKLAEIFINGVTLK